MELDISHLPIIDTHEHLADEQHRVNNERDVLSLFLRHYITTDLANAGLSPEKIEQLRDPAVPIEKRWIDLEPFWQQVAHTAYAQALKIAVRDLYQIDHINRETIAEIAKKVEEASKPGLYARVFQKAGIDMAVVNDLDFIYNPNAMFESPIPRPSDPPGLVKKVFNGRALVYIRSKMQIVRMQELLNRGAIHSLLDWLEIIKYVISQFPDTVGLKFPHAYITSLATLKPSYDEAERVFNHLLGAPYMDENLSHTECKPLVDYLIHFAIQQAVVNNLPVQIHTGLLEGSYNNLQNSNPLLLTPLLMEYREARFVLFHGGYPWIREFIALGKMFPNVWLDMVWVWIISPQAGRVMLNEIIETIPQNKVTAFGGDYMFVEGCYGHSVMARQNITRVLQDKVAEGWFGVDEALMYARAILHDNALDLYSRPR